MTGTESEDWTSEFKIESIADLNFVIGDDFISVGMQDDAPAELKRRILAALVSYKFQLSSIDYTLKRYVKPEQYEIADTTLGHSISQYLSKAWQDLQSELARLHTKGELSFGIVGSELTLYRVPYVLDTARRLSNRGQLLEVLPLLRLCLEMVSWAHVAYRTKDEGAVVALKAQRCISELKSIYGSAGQIYGYLSKFTHWGHAIHAEFLHFAESQVSIVHASRRYRAVSLALCLVVLDVCVEVARGIYAEKADALALKVQGALCPDGARYSCQFLHRLSELAEFEDLQHIRAFLK